MNEQKKTVREWLNELPEPIRTRALKNCTEHQLNSYVLSRSSAIHSFSWGRSNEGNLGFHYWCLVWEEKYSEACALLGETLQTEQTEPHYMETAIDQAIREIAKKEYGKFWVELDDSQKAHLVVPVAIRYAELVNNKKQ